MARIRTIKSFDLSRLPTVNEVWPFDSGIYILRENGGHAKVGLCTHPMRRLSTLQCGNPRQLFFDAIFLGPRPDCRYIELATFQEFRDRIVRGEWIDAASQDILRFWDQFREMQ